MLDVLKKRLEKPESVTLQRPKVSDTLEELSKNFSLGRLNHFIKILTVKEICFWLLQIENILRHQARQYYVDWVRYIDFVRLF